MRLHARQVAIAAGADSHEVELVVQRLTGEGVIRADRAETILDQLRSEL
jgi:hydroxymethylglutaryl-CoA reductase